MKYKILSFSEGGNPANERGEAVVIDLGERGVVFALIDPDAERELYKAFPVEGPTSYNGISHYNKILKPGVKAELKKRIPKMVTFKDLNDPKSVQLVYSQFREKITDNFDKALGAGVRLKSVVVEITEEPVTWGYVDQWLPKNYQKIIVDGWRSLDSETQKKLYGLTGFKKGEL